ncbi:MAG TPA: hypothetical protein EYP43_01435, partial [Thermoplasmata archaeon]|nr:hypothetical protein [Thermoplasmata archaeon]
AGNVSFRVADINPGSLDGEPRYVELPVRYPRLGGRVLLVTRTGARMRDIALRPRENLLLIEVLEGGYQVLAGGGRPTAELPVHLAIHDMLQGSRPEHRAVLHAHPTALLAFSHLPLRGKMESLMRLHPETYFHLPEHIRFIPYHIPGSEDLARATVEALENSRVAIWERHGVIATGGTFAHALDPIEILEKVAQAYMMVAPVLGSDMSGVGLSSDEIEATEEAAGRMSVDVPFDR